MRWCFVFFLLNKLASPVGLFTIAIRVIVQIFRLILPLFFFRLRSCFLLMLLFSINLMRSVSLFLSKGNIPLSKNFQGFRISSCVPKSCRKLGAPSNPKSSAVNLKLELTAAYKLMTDSSESGLIGWEGCLIVIEVRLLGMFLIGESRDSITISFPFLRTLVSWSSCSALFSFLWG